MYVCDQVVIQSNLVNMNWWIFICTFHVYYDMSVQSSTLSGAMSDRLTVQKEGLNKGRQFFTCSKPREDQCGFFEWADDVPTSNITPGLFLCCWYRGNLVDKGKNYCLVGEKRFVEKIPW